MLLRYFLLWICLLFSTHAAAGGDPLLNKVINSFSINDGFHTEFTQSITYTDKNKTLYKGKLAIRHPKMFRWQYIQPYAQLFVSNGQGVWHYEEDLLQAQWLQQLDSIDPVVMRLLDGRMSPKELQVNSVKHDHQTSVYHVQLDNNGPTLWLGIQRDLFKLLWLESRDVLGNKNRMTFKNIIHRAPALSVFNFTPPDDVDIIGKPNKEKTND